MRVHFGGKPIGQNSISFVSESKIKSFCLRKNSNSLKNKFSNFISWEFPFMGYFNHTLQFARFETNVLQSSSIVILNIN